MAEVTQVEELENQKKDAQKLAERGQMARRLASNRDFRKLILDGFCLEDAARYAQESGDPLLSAEQRADALNMAQASGHLKRYLSFQIRMGVTAERSLVELDEALTEARAEEAANAAEVPV